MVDAFFNELNDLTEEEILSMILSNEDSDLFIKLMQYYYLRFKSPFESTPCLCLFMPERCDLHEEGEIE